MIIVTGASGLIGTSISALLRSKGYAVMCIDTREVDTPEIVRIDTHSDAMMAILHEQDITGIIHLAGVSNFVDAQNHSELCHRDNVECLDRMFKALAGKQSKPWFIYASSCEVYGQAENFPVSENTSLAPINTYGKCKVAAEQLCAEASLHGQRVLIIRFSNVYGWAYDHETRVVPSYIRHAKLSQELCVEGADNIADYTHIADVTEGLYKAIQYIGSDKRIVPVLNFVSGKGTSLHELAQLVIEKTGTGSIKQCRPLDYAVKKFVGDPSLALKELGWKTEIDIEAGIERFIPKVFASMKNRVKA